MCWIYRSWSCEYTSTAYAMSTMHTMGTKTMEIILFFADIVAIA